MKSFQEIYTELQDQTGDDSSAQLTIFKRHINDTQHLVLGNHSWKFLEFTANMTTVADTGRYEIPANVRKIQHVVTLDSNSEVDQIVDPVEDPDFWEHLQRRNSSSSDITQYFYVEGNDLLIWPNFSTAGLTIRARGRKSVVDMSLDDYNTGTITSVANGDTALVGSSTSWNGRKPVGEQWIRIDYTTGDLRWYKVSSIDSDTAITLEKNYLGTSIAAATESYTLGEMPVIPEAYQNILFYRPMALYYMKLENMAMADHYWTMYDGGYELGRAKRPGGLVYQMIQEQLGAVDSKYFPPQGSKEELSSEFLAKDEISTLG